MSRLRLVAAVLLLLSTVPLASYAEMSEPSSSNAPVQLDTVAQKDKELFDRLHISERFGAQFRPHHSVCDRGNETHCDARVITDAAGTPNATPKAILGMGPQQLRGAYGLSGNANGSSIIAIVDAYDDPNITNDLAVYSSTFGLPQLPTCVGPIANATSPCFKKVDQQGGTRYPAKDFRLVSRNRARCRNGSRDVPKLQHSPR